MYILAVVSMASMPMRRVGILPSLVRRAQRRMELSRFALRIFTHTNFVPLRGGTE